MSKEESTKFEYKKINSKFIFSDSSYQRAVDMNRVGRIVANFNGALVNPIKVSFRDDKYYVFDGQHTLSALKIMNDNVDLSVDCKVYYNLTLEDEAKLFAEQNGISRTVESIAKFRALKTAGDINICAFQKLTENAGVKMDFTKGKSSSKIIACTKAYYIYNHTTEKEYSEILEIANESWDGSAESFNTEILGGIYMFYKTYKGRFDVKTLKRQLSKVSPVFITREGKLSSKTSDARFARVILSVYNKKLRLNRLEDEF